MRIALTHLVSKTPMPQQGAVSFVLSEVWNTDPIGTQVAELSVDGGESMYTWSLVHDAVGRFVIAPLSNIVRTALIVAAGIYEITVKAVGVLTGAVLTANITVEVQAGVGL